MKNTESDIESRVLNAQENTAALEQLIKDYLPFIKKQLTGFRSQALEYEDMLSTATLVFINCVKQYQSGRGGFLPFVQISIKNRLIDEMRREARRQHLPLHSTEGRETAAEEILAFSDYNQKMEQLNLSLEIDCFSKELAGYDITLMELSRKSPRHRKSRLLSLRIAQALLMDEAKSCQLRNRHLLPQKELAAEFQISVKTIEKHRKYIVALFLLISGNYPCINAFLPKPEVTEP